MTWAERRMTWILSLKEARTSYLKGAISWPLTGRDRVAVLHAGDVTEPGDVRGMLYIPDDSLAHDWKGKLAGELGRAGIGVDLKALTI